MNLNGKADPYKQIRFQDGVRAMAFTAAEEYVSGRQSFAEYYSVSLAELDKLVNETRKEFGMKPFDTNGGGNVFQFRNRTPDYGYPSPSGEPLSTLPVIDVAKDPIPPRDWAVRDRIPARNVSLLSGEGAIGKSILLLQLAASIVLARDWLGTVPEPGPVMYLSCEDDDAWPMRL
jgi:AAA domain